MITLSNKQEEAKEKMEQSLGRTPLVGFKTYNDFDDYMKFLIKQIRKKINFNKKVKEGKIDLQKVREKKEKNILEYYSKEENLRKYAIKYYEKYFPSPKKLINKLQYKSKNKDIAIEVVKKLGEQGIIATEMSLCKNYMLSYFNQGKNYRKVKELLLKKMFSKDVIEELLETYKESNGSLLDYEQTKKKVLSLLEKGKNKYYIYSKLASIEEDKKIIDLVIEELSFDNTHIIKKELEKLKSKGLEKQRIISRMSMKGFLYGDYSEFL